MAKLNYPCQKSGTELVYRISDYGVHPSYIRTLDDVDFGVAVHGDDVPWPAPVDCQDPQYELVISRWEPSTSQPLDRRTLSQFLHDASGRGTHTEADFLNSTEIHVVCRAVAGISDGGFAAHYSRFNHSLELRADIDGLDEFFDFHPGVVNTEGSFIVCLSSAFNQRSAPVRAADMQRHGLQFFNFPLDVMDRIRERNREIGRTVVSIAFAAAALGWEVRLLGASLGFEALKRMSGLRTKGALANEVPVAALIVFPTSLVYSSRWHFPPADPITINIRDLRSRILLYFDDSIRWRGSPDCVHVNQASEPFARALAAAADGCHPFEAMDVTSELPGLTPAGSFCYVERHALRSVLACSRGGGRSEAEIDPSSVDKLRFRQFLCRCWPALEWDPIFPHSALPWTYSPRVDMYVVVNRVTGIKSGLYCLVRTFLPHATDDAHLWTSAERTSPELPLFLVRREVDYNSASSLELLDKSAFFVLMVGYYRNFKEEYLMLKRQIWEAGFLGELLRIEAAAQDLLACEIPITGGDCDFWENFLGLSMEFQVLSLYVVGGDCITVEKGTEWHQQFNC